MGERKKVRVNEGDRDREKREAYKDSMRERERKNIYILKERV